MTDEAVKRGDRQGQLAKASVALGMLALVALVGALFVVNAYSDGDRWYLPGAAIGLVAVGLGWTARKWVGIVLGAVPLVTFCVLVIDGVVDGML